ncbi:methylmalonyl Co-A mutase-associated GTPase MeaB [Pseudemcibacter aquimaris]|uniref:methylmalonyl Co-A mutase-associated GTPase MeaB n=1 Tax=Pseudemcibacter aquimaris TaxID=2857064 RepID=UPI0020130E67|nr:methylmalonyl Co-A mutase-associated GTPase MeaB [Pseudemcibacter aquimaris]MCC3862374.1 methylmalonyl Co-A mutase-associated GTPase MeaB [Pseudemcibacter aquimaris]WDU59195.1 methylmalonyl Co-A mutase-associated GTPase MeaB [Pseudemcibacter aquimaris]
MSELADKIITGNRRAVAKAITLIESSRTDHQEKAQKLLNKLLPHTGKGLRLGLTGIPGVGKSTFIESFGKLLTGQGLKVAVLAVDPSSKITGGSILGDKTRMEELARDPNAFIRPTPSKGTLGGIARYTREAMMILEAAGYDVIIIETVGVGQSEVAVHDMVDMFLLLLSPGGGDELQGIKRGIMELADIVIINKADGDFENAAGLAAGDVKNALHLMRQKSENWVVKTLKTSAINNQGIDEVWQAVCDYKEAMQTSGEFDAKRAEQEIDNIWKELNEFLTSEVKTRQKSEIKTLEKAVKDKSITPLEAAKTLYESLIKPVKKH